MKAWILAAVISFGALDAWAAAAVCKPPVSPPIAPNGETATREEMLEAQGILKSYSAAIAQFTQCVQKSGGTEIEINRIVNHLEKLGVRFNAELRKFKLRAGNS